MSGAFCFSLSSRAQRRIQRRTHYSHPGISSSRAQRRIQRGLILSPRHFVIQSAAKDPAQNPLQSSRHFVIQSAAKDPARTHTVTPAFRHPERSEGSSAELITVIPALCRDHLTLFLLQGVYDKGGLAPSLRLNANNYSRLRCSTSHLAFAHSSKVSSARWSLASCIKCK